MAWVVTMANTPFTWQAGHRTDAPAPRTASWSRWGVRD